MPTSGTASMKKVGNLNEGRVSEFLKLEILHVTFTTIHKHNCKFISVKFDQN